MVHVRELRSYLVLSERRPLEIYFVLEAAVMASAEVEFKTPGADDGVGALEDVGREEEGESLAAIFQRESNQIQRVKYVIFISISSFKKSSPRFLNFVFFPPEGPRAATYSSSSTSDS